ncbi:HAMP domain-containing protein [Pseudoalteromonas sp. B193]
MPLRIDSVEELKTPRITSDHIELTRPIYDNEQVVGYVYMRGSLESLEVYIERKILIDVLLTLLILAVVYFIAIKVQRRIAKPIEQLSMLLQDVSKNHNYDARAPVTDVKEISALSNSLNIMLTRTKKQLERHEKDKQEIKQLNLSLEEKVNQRTIALREQIKSFYQLLSGCINTKHKLLKTKKWHL